MMSPLCYPTPVWFPSFPAHVLSYDTSSMMLVMTLSITGSCPGLIEHLDWYEEMPSLCPGHCFAGHSRMVLSNQPFPWYLSGLWADCWFIALSWSLNRLLTAEEPSFVPSKPLLLIQRQFGYSNYMELLCAIRDLARKEPPLQALTCFLWIHIQSYSRIANITVIDYQYFKVLLITE